MKVIDLEAHFMTRPFAEYVRAKQDVPKINPVHDALCDLGEGRLKAMDSAGVDMQVISFGLTSPNLQQFDAAEATEWAMKINDELAVAVKQHPDRYVGLAAIAPQNPDGAASELERAVMMLGLKGVMIQSHARNEYLDDRKYWGIFEKAEKLDVPVYLHPGTPSTAILSGYSGYGQSLWGSPFGFGADASLHAMRLILSGLFDTFPKLKLVLAHMGEGLPFWLHRIDLEFYRPNYVKPNIKKRPSDYIKDNCIITTSGMFFEPAFLCAYLALGADKIAFAVDYPYEQSKEGVGFINGLPICDPDKEKVFHVTAEKLLKL
jgi:5-carboxyvanillate decarboxylase